MPPSLSYIVCWLLGTHTANPSARKQTNHKIQLPLWLHEALRGHPDTDHNIWPLTPSQALFPREALRKLLHFKLRAESVPSEPSPPQACCFQADLGQNVFSSLLSICCGSDIGGICLFTCWSLSGWCGDGGRRHGPF